MYGDDRCAECEYREDCEIADNVNFCSRCKEWLFCEVESEQCKVGFFIECEKCENGFAPYDDFVDDYIGDYDD